MLGIGLPSLLAVVTDSRSVSVHITSHGKNSHLLSAAHLCRSTCSSTSEAVSLTATAAPSSGSASGADGGMGSALPKLQLYNSMSGTKEVFTAREGQGSAVSMYICGVTVYSMSHIGAAV